MKRILAYILVFLLLFSVGCRHEHVFSDATCTAPKTCSECGETEGEAAPHDFLDATCSAPMTCSHCGKTEGEILPHDFSDATCSSPSVCAFCGETTGETLPHFQSGWQNVEINYINGTAAQESPCTLCGQIMETRTIDLETFHDGENFLFTPAEFLERLEALLMENGYGELSHRYEALSDDAWLSCILSSGEDLLLGIDFYRDQNRFLVSEEDSGPFDMVSFYSFRYDPEEVTLLMQSAFTCCDPMIEDPAGFAESVMMEGFYGSFMEREALDFVYAYSQGSSIFLVSLETVE